MNLQPLDTVYIPVSIKERYPETKGVYFEFCGGTIPMIGWYQGDNREHAGATEWLEEKKDHYVISKEQLREMIIEAFVAGDERGTGEIPFNGEQYFTQTYDSK